MECTRRIEHVNEVCISAPFGGMGGSPPHGDVGRGTRTIPRSAHAYRLSSSHPRFALAELLPRGAKCVRQAVCCVSWRTCIRRRRDWARRACETRTSTHAALVGATDHGLEWPHVSPIHRTGTGCGPAPTGHREDRYPYLRQGPGKGEAPAVVGKLQGPLASHQSQLDRTHEPIL